MTTTIHEPKFPHIDVCLTGQNGNAFSIIARVRSAMVKNGVGATDIDAFTEEAMSGDYDNLLRTCIKYVTVI